MGSGLRRLAKIVGGITTIAGDGTVTKFNAAGEVKSVKKPKPRAPRKKVAKPYTPTSEQLISAELGSGHPTTPDTHLVFYSDPTDPAQPTGFMIREGAAAAKHTKGLLLTAGYRKVTIYGNLHHFD